MNVEVNVHKYFCLSHVVNAVFLLDRLGMCFMALNNSKHINTIIVYPKLICILIGIY